MDRRLKLKTLEYGASLVAVRNREQLNATHREGLSPDCSLEDF